MPSWTRMELRVAERDGPHDDSGAPMDEDAAWARLVAAFEQEPAAGSGPWPTAEDLHDGDNERRDAPDQQDARDRNARDAPAPERRGRDDGSDGRPHGFVVRAPQPGPRDYALPDDEDEGHFEPPEPPPLPEADTTTKFAWLAVLGGPLLMVGFVLFQQPLAWWATVVGVGGFVGGFATLVARMKDRTEDDDDPHGGAVV